MFLEPRGVELVNYIEKFHGMTGLIPDRAAMCTFLTNHGFELTNLATLIDSDLFQKSMRVRGINLSPHNDGHLSPRQIATISVMTNLSDRRSDEKKLRDLGVSTAEWENWRLDKNFNTYLEERVERLLGNSISDAHLGLVRSAKGGNVPAIKLLYEITGRYNPEKDSVLNVQMLLARIVEIIQTHVKDPEVLQGLGTDLTQLAIEAGQQQQKSVTHSA